MAILLQNVQRKAFFVMQCRRAAFVFLTGSLCVKCGGVYFKMCGE